MRSTATDPATGAEILIPNVTRSLTAPAVGSNGNRLALLAVLSLLIALFIAFETLLPLRTAIKIGADEDFELSKAALVLKGYKLYTEIWNDQPPLYTSLLTTAAKLTPSKASEKERSKEAPEKSSSPNAILGPRLLTVGCSILLISAFFLLTHRVHSVSSLSFLPSVKSPLAVAAIATLLLIGSPGFLELSSSCMQEIPALAPVIASIALLLVSPGRAAALNGIGKSGTHWNASLPVLAGLLFALGLQLKLIGIIYSPLILLVLWIRSATLHSLVKTQDLRSALRLFATSCSFFGVSTLMGFVAINWLTGSPLTVQLQQAWAAHFASAKSSEYGSAQEHVYDWTVILKNWEATIPALFGPFFLIRSAKNHTVRDKLPGGGGYPFRSSSFNHRLLTLLPLFWLALTMGVFALHKPWWAYYYVHNAVPICWCAAVSFVGVIELLSRPRTKQSTLHARLIFRFTPRLMYSLFALASIVWVGARIYGQVVDMRASPRTYSSYVLKKIERYKPFTTFMFTDQPIYSFHAGLPVPPHLAMLSLKRMWTGEMTNERVAAELESVKPGIILWRNDSKEVPFQELLNTEYQPVYIDNANKLFVHKTIARKGFL